MSSLYASNFGPVSDGRLLYSNSNSGSLSASGDNIFSLETVSGLYTAGLLYLRGNENGVNQTIKVYSWNLSYYSPSNTRYCRLQLISSNGLNNSYGDVYAYFSNYSGDYTNTNQSNSGTSTSVSDIFFRNGAGAACTYSYSLWRMG
jgi:hypothetical protein